MIKIKREDAFYLPNSDVFPAPIYDPHIESGLRMTHSHCVFRAREGPLQHLLQLAITHLLDTLTNACPPIGLEAPRGSAVCFTHCDIPMLYTARG